MVVVLGVVFFFIVLSLSKVSPFSPENTSGRVGGFGTPTSQFASRAWVGQGAGFRRYTTIGFGISAKSP